VPVTVRVRGFGAIANAREIARAFATAHPEATLAGAPSGSHDAIAALVAVDPSPNRTVAAIVDAFPRVPEWSAESVVPFSSERKWSAANFGVRGSWVMGATEVLAGASASVTDMAARHASQGARVVLVGREHGAARDTASPPDVTPVALIVLREHLRPDAADIVAYYRREGVDVKVLSGDHPQTVAALAHAVGISGAGAAFDARQLPSSETALADVAENTSVFGRIRPEQKQAIVRALQERGHVVAMTGDGVNDVLALKTADVGVAMGSGSAAARAVARLTLLHDSFASLPFAIREGRRVIANLERVAAFFLTKTVYAMIITLAVVVRVAPFPLLPRQLSLVGLLAIGVPAFALSFAPAHERARPRFVQRTLRFVIPAGVVVGASAYAAFEISLARGAGLNDARTVATVVLIAVGLWIVGRVARPLQLWKLALIALMVLAAGVIFLVPLGRTVYGVAILAPDAWLVATLTSAAAICCLEVGVRVASRSR